MNYKYLMIFLVSIISVSSSTLAMSAEQTSIPGGSDNGASYNPEQFRNTMVDLLKGVEGATGLPGDASKAYAEATPTEIETAYGFWQQKELFFLAVPNVLNQIELAKRRPDYAKLAGPKTQAAPGNATVMAASPVYPDYPTGVVYTMLEALGLVSTPGQRCGGQALENYKAAMFGAETAIFLGEAACSAAGCDPSGAVCISICGPVELVKIGVETAVLPLKLCKDLDEDIDSAESSADYANGVSILDEIDNQNSAIDDIASDLTAHDARLVTHDIDMGNQLSTHDADIKAKLDSVIANQEEIIDLLTTPEGRRPGWNK